MSKKIAPKTFIVFTIFQLFMIFAIAVLCNRFIPQSLRRIEWQIGLILLTSTLCCIGMYMTGKDTARPNGV